jgi:hypothetical protein
MKVFWAWQADIEGKIARRFVREALRRVTRLLSSLNGELRSASPPYELTPAIIRGRNSRSI